MSDEHTDAMRAALETIETLMRKYDTDEYTWEKYWEGYTDGLQKALNIIEDHFPHLMERKTA